LNSYHEIQEADLLNQEWIIVENRPGFNPVSLIGIEARQWRRYKVIIAISSDSNRAVDLIYIDMGYLQIA
jgi:hypothetical protein